MENSREFPFPFPEFPGIVGMEIENFKTCIIPDIPDSPGMGMNFFGNPGKEIFSFFHLSKFNFLTIDSLELFIIEWKLFGFFHSIFIIYQLL